jgi:hypothetical protein
LIASAAIAAEVNVVGLATHHGTYFNEVLSITALALPLWRWGGFDCVAQEVLDALELTGRHAPLDEGFEFGLVDFNGHGAVPPLM